MPWSQPRGSARQKLPQAYLVGRQALHWAVEGIDAEVAVAALWLQRLSYLSANATDQRTTAPEAHSYQRNSLPKFMTSCNTMVGVILYNISAVYFQAGIETSLPTAAHRCFDG